MQGQQAGCGGSGAPPLRRHMMHSGLYMPGIRQAMVVCAMTCHAPDRPAMPLGHGTAHREVGQSTGTALHHHILESGLDQHGHARRGQRHAALVLKRLTGHACRQEERE